MEGKMYIYTYDYPHVNKFCSFPILYLLLEYKFWSWNLEPTCFHQIWYNQIWVVSHVHVFHRLHNNLHGGLFILFSIITLKENIQERELWIYK